MWSVRSSPVVVHGSRLPITQKPLGLRDNFLLVLVRVLQRRRAHRVCVHVCGETGREEFIKETGLHHCGSWQVSGPVVSKLETQLCCSGLKAGRLELPKNQCFWVWGQEKSPASLLKGNQARRIPSCSGEGQLFVLLKTSVGWIMMLGKAIVYLVYRFKCKICPNTPSQKHPEYCLNKYLSICWPSQVDTQDSPSPPLSSEGFHSWQCPITGHGMM